VKTILGIDCGTQSTKVLVYDPASRNVIARAQTSHELISGEDGTREQEAGWWIDALKSCLASIDPRILSSVAAVGVSGQQHGFVPLGRNGEVLAPVKLWCDTSTVAECAEITARFGGEKKLLAEAGNLILPGYTASKILWLKKNRPELYGRIKTILLPHDYLNYRLTGRLVMEFGDASGTGFLDVRNRAWSDAVLRAIDPERDLMSCLPPLIDAVEPAGFVTQEASAAFLLPAGIPVASGGGDNMMGAIGTGTNVHGTLTVSLGTSGTLYGFSDEPIVDPEGLLAAFCSSSGGWLPLLCTMNCTVATELMRSLLGSDLAAMESLAGDARPGSDGVLVLPFFNGERAPSLPHGRGCIVGLTPDNFSRGNLLRAAMESALFGLRLGLESFTRLGFTPKEIRIIGGGSRSALWRQMAADVFDLPVVCPVEGEAAAFGAALQAYWALRNHDGKRVELADILDEHVQLGGDKKHLPDRKSASLYREACQQYKKYVGAVTPLYR
jgi:xylulokinase